MNLKHKLIKLHWLLSCQFGIDFRIFIKSLCSLPLYFKEKRKFRKNYNGQMNFMPCLQDRYEEGGATKSEYFWQDLIVARLIYKVNPVKHVDVGSRVDGFVSHVASFREIEVFDVRPITTQIPGVIFKQADMMANDDLIDYCDSLSCLHALEHFGLGRYGDPIDTEGYSRGLANMAKLLKSSGIFYLATPIGQERVEFNAHRVFNPEHIINLAKKEGLSLQTFTIIDVNGTVQEMNVTSEVLKALSNKVYNLGIFVFKKSVGNM